MLRFTLSSYLHRVKDVDIVLVFPATFVEEAVFSPLYV
jgi:hypothetical protein